MGAGVDTLDGGEGDDVLISGLLGGGRRHARWR